jgi:hypothetical protein
MKRQAIIIMDRFRKSSEQEKVALQQAKEALSLRDTAVAEAALATSREDYMLDLITDASLDMAGMLPEFLSFCPYTLLLSVSHCVLLLYQVPF